MPRLSLGFPVRTAGRGRGQGGILPREPWPWGKCQELECRQTPSSLLACFSVRLPKPKIIIPPLEQHATKELVLSRALCVSGAFFSANELLGLGAFPAWQSRKQNMCPVLFKSCDEVEALTSEIKYVQSKELSGKNVCEPTDHFRRANAPPLGA